MLHSQLELLVKLGLREQVELKQQKNLVKRELILTKLKLEQKPLALAVLELVLELAWPLKS